MGQTMNEKQTIDNDKNKNNKQSNNEEKTNGHEGSDHKEEMAMLAVMMMMMLLREKEDYDKKDCIYNADIIVKTKISVILLAHVK